MRRYPIAAAGTQSLDGNLRSIADFVARREGAYRSRVETDRLVEKRFVKALLDQTE